jgi:2-phosphoglycolate phosphatase
VIRLAIFDLDGTLVDSRLDLCLAVNHALRVVGLPERTLDEVASFVGEGAVKLVERAVAPRADLVGPALAAWWEHYEAHLLDNTVLYPGLAELLAHAPCALAVHTNKPGALARRLLDGLGVLARFAAVVGGDEAPRKPDPAGARAILDHVGIPPHEAVFVGDSLVDLATARAVPLRFEAVGWGLVSTERLLAAGAAPPARDAAELRARLEAKQVEAPRRAPVDPRLSLEERVQALLKEGRSREAATDAIQTLGPQVLAYLTALLKNEGDARDVFSHFAEDLWKGLAGWRGEASLRGWAYRIAWHASVRWVRDPFRQRGQRLETTEASRLAQEVRSSIAENAWREERMARLRDLLDPEERTLLILRIDRDLSWREVADVLAEDGCPAPSEAALRKRFERLKEKLGKAARDEGLIE